MSEAAYTVGVSRSAQKEIRALDETIRIRVVQSISLLAQIRDPPVAGSL